MFCEVLKKIGFKLTDLTWESCYAARPNERYPTTWIRASNKNMNDGIRNKSWEIHSSRTKSWRLCIKLCAGTMPNSVCVKHAHTHMYMIHIGMHVFLV